MAVRARAERKVEEKSDELDPGFVQRTYRSSAVIIGFMCLTLAARGVEWAAVPVLCGGALSVALIWLNDTGFCLLYAPKAEESGEAGKAARAKRLRTISWVAVAKYLGVAALVTLAVRYWSFRQVAAFAGGFCLVHIGIVLRVLSRLWLARMNESSK